MKLKRTLILILFIISTKPFLSTFAEDYARWELPEGAKLRLGKGKINNIYGRSPYQFSSDSNQLIVFTSIGIWVYDVQTGKELGLVTKHTEKGDDYVVLSPDCRTFADKHNSTDGNRIELWDLQTGEISTTFDNRGVKVNSVAYHPDGKLLLSGDAEGVIRLWNIDTGENKVLLARNKPIGSAAFSPDGETIIERSKEDALLLDATDGKIKTILENADDMHRISFGPDWKLLIGENLREIKIWDAESGKAIIKLEYPSMAKQFALSPDKKTIASAENNDTSVRLLDVHTGELKKTFRGEKMRRSVQSIAFSPNGRTIAIAAYDEIRLWDIDSGIHKATLNAIGSLSNLLFSPDGQTLVARGYTSKRDSGLFLWDIDKTDLQESKLRHFITGHNGEITCLAFKPDGQTLATGHDYLVRLWDVSDGKHLTTGHGHPFQVQVRSVGFSPDGEKLMSLNLSIQSSRSKAQVLVWDASTGEYQVTLKGHGKAFGNSRPWHPNSLVFSSDGKKLLSGSLDGTVRIWNPRTKSRGSLLHNVWGSIFGHQRTTLKAHKDHVLSVALSPDESMIASGSSDNTVRLWDARKRKLIATLGEINIDPSSEKSKSKNSLILKENTGAIHSLAFSPDGKTLIVGNKKQVVLWNTYTTKRTMSVTLKSNSTASEYITTVLDNKDVPSTKSRNIQSGNSRDVRFRETSITTFALSPDGSTLAVGTAKGGIVLLEGTSFNVKRTYVVRPMEWITDLSFSPDGSTLASGSSDGTVLIWDVEP